MKTIVSEVLCTTEVKRSKFLAYLVPIEKTKGFQEQLKKEHPKANHVVYAMRWLNGFEQIVESSSDDGEPKGSAGVPALNVLRGEELIACGVFIVRYFGGIKLGTGGMARAYALSVKNSLAEATLVAYKKKIEYTFSSTYSEIEQILYWLKKENIGVEHREFGLEDVQWVVRGEEEAIKKLPW
jgi:uncharacterized YigZ family protein